MYRFALSLFAAPNGFIRAASGKRLASSEAGSPLSYVLPVRLPFHVLGSRSRRRDRARVPRGAAGVRGYHVDELWQVLSSVTTHVGLKDKRGKSADHVRTSALGPVRA